MVLRVVFIFCCIIAFRSNAQQLFHKIVGTWSPDQGNSGMQIFDNGFIACGSTGGGTNGNSDILLARTDVEGNLKWQKAIGFAQVEQGYSVVMDVDSGFLIAGFTNSIGAGGYDVLLIKTDTSGNKLWHKTFGGADWELGYRIIRLSSGGFAIAGQSYTGGAGNGDGYFIRLDASGDVVWEKKFGGPEEDGFYSLRETQDGGFVLCGHSFSFNSNGTKEAYIVRTDAGGVLQWERSYGDSLDMYAKDIEENNDGGFIFVGGAHSRPDSTNDDGFFMRISPSGTLIRYDFVSGNPGGRDVQQSICRADANMFFTVGLTSYVGSNDVYLFYLDPSLNLTGNRTCGDPFHSGTLDIGNFVTRTNDNRFLVIGTTAGYSTIPNDNMFIATFDNAGNTVAPPTYYVDVKETSISDKVRIINNGSDLITLELPDNYANSRLVFHDVTGKAVMPDVIINGSSIEVNLKDLTAGIYFVSVIINEQVITGKLLKQ